MYPWKQLRISSLWRRLADLKPSESGDPSQVPTRLSSHAASSLNGRLPPVALLGRAHVPATPLDRNSSPFLSGHPQQCCGGGVSGPWTTAGPIP